MIWCSFVNCFLINVSDALHLLLRYNIIPSIALVEKLYLRLMFVILVYIIIFKKQVFYFVQKIYNIMLQPKY